MNCAFYNNRHFGRQMRSFSRKNGTLLNTFKTSTALVMLFACAVAPAHSGVVSLGGGGTLATSTNDTYIDNTGPYSVVGGTGGGGLLLKPNTTGSNDAIVISGTTINVTQIHIANEGRAIDIGPTDVLSGSYASSGSYSVLLQGNSLTAKAGYGEAAFSARTANGTITLDTTGGSPNTITGAYGYSVAGSSLGNVSVALNIGPDQITASNGSWVADGIQVISAGNGTVSIDTTGTAISVPDGYFTESVAGIYVDGSSDVTLGGSHGGLSGTITVPNSYGISINAWGNTQTTRITLSSSETITARSGIYTSGHNTIIDSFGTIIAGTDPAISGTADTMTVTLESGSRTVGKVQASQSGGSVSTINIYTGADISGTTFEGYSGGSNTLHLKGVGSAVFDIGTTTNISSIQKDDAGTWAITNSGSASSIAFTVNAGTIRLSADHDLGTDSTLLLKDGGAVGFSAGGMYTHVIYVEGDTTFDTAGNTIGFAGQLFSNGPASSNIKLVGGGELDLQNTNTYSGNITITSGTTLEVCCSSSSGSITGSIINNGTFIFNRADPTIYSSAISGSGTLVEDNGSVLILTGTNTYSGGTSISSGATLQLGNGGTTGSVIGNITDNGVLVFDRSDFVSYGGVISGSGSLSQTGSGSLILTNNNTYTGGTTIASGATLQLGDGGTTGSIVGTVIDNGVLVFNRSDTYIFTGNLSGTGAISLIGSGRVIFKGYNSLTGGLGIGAGSTVHLADLGYINVPITNNGIIDFSPASDLVFSNTITGNGGLTVSGVGTLILTGNSTYTGGTTITSGTLQISSGGSITGPIANNGAVVFDRPDNYTVSGVISGNGIVRQIGYGTLILAGTNTYTGNTYVDIGMVSVASDANLGNGGTLVMAPGTGILLTGGGIFSHPVTVAGDPVFNVATGTTAIWSGQISDASTPGDVEITGGGTLALTNSANSYSGGTVVKSGSTLRIATDHALGATTGALTLGDATTSGTLQFGASASLDPTRAVILGAGGATIDTNGFNTTLVQAVSGTGGLTKTGTGTLTVTGANTYSGATTVTAGTLTIGDATHTTSTVGGGGVTVAAGANLSGFGKIAGTVINSGTIVTGLSAGSLTLGGLTQNAGGSLVVELSPSSASQLTVTGTANLGGTLHADFLSGASTPHVYSVLSANSINGTFASLTITGTASDMIFGVRYAPSGHEVDVVAMPQSAGQIYGDLRTAAFDTAFTLNNIVMDRLSSEKTPAGVWSVWARGVFGSAHTDGENNVRAFNSTLVGFIGGADYGFVDGFSAHAAVAYGNSDLKLSGHATKASISSVYVSLAGHAPLAGFTIDASSFYLTNSTALTRDTEWAGFAAANPDSSVFGLVVQAGLPLLDGDLIPAARLSYADFTRSAHSETGADAMNLAVASASASEVRSDFGVQYAHHFTAGETVLIPSLKAFLDQTLSAPEGSAMRLISTSISFTSPSAEADRTAALIGMGLKVVFEDGLTVDLDLDSRMGSRQTETTGTVGVSWKF